MNISIDKQIQKNKFSQLSKTFTGTLKDAQEALQGIEDRYTSIKKLQKSIRRSTYEPIKDTGNHISLDILQIAYEVKKEMRLYRLKDIYYIVVQNTNSPIELKDFLRNNFSKLKLNSKYNSLLWDYIYKNSDVLDDLIVQRFGVSRSYIRNCLKTGTFVSKSFCYEYFTTGYYIGYTELEKLLIASIDSNLFSNEELNTMLMHNSNFLFLLTILSKNRLDKNKMENVEILKRILTKDNFDKAFKVWNSIPYYNR